MRSAFSKAEVLVGHNIIRFDIPVLERLLGIKIKAKLVDTLALSWYLQPKRSRHGLESYGDDFNIEKPLVEDWESQDISVYTHRCEQDVRINTHLWNAQWAKLLLIYDGDEEAIWKFLDYLSFKMECARLAEESGWKVDLELAKEELDRLEKLQGEKILELKGIMPRVPVMVKKTKPKVMTKKDGTPSKHALVWFQTLKDYRLPEDSEEITIVQEYADPNPASPVQIKKYLENLGWKPRTFKHKEGRQIPQINLENGKGICPSIKELYEIEPRLEVLDGLSILNHRIPILRGFLETADENGFVKAQIQGLTNTLRFQHSHPCVNLPRSTRPFAEGIRGSLTAPPGYELCGADMSSLEDRLKQHFIYPLDPQYVESMNREDYDPHLALALMAGMLTKEEVEGYKSGGDNYKFVKPIRDIAKNGNYACQYGAYPPRLQITCSISLDKAKELFEGYWKLNWSIKEVANAQKVKTIEDGSMWLWNPISKFWYSLRKDNDRFSTLIQGTASYVFDLWVRRVLRDRRQITAQFHDEIVLCVKKGYREQITEYLNQTISETNQILKLNRELGIGIQFGDRYSEIH